MVIIVIQSTIENLAAQTANLFLQNGYNHRSIHEKEVVKRKIILLHKQHGCDCYSPEIMALFLRDAERRYQRQEIGKTRFRFYQKTANYLGKYPKVTIHGKGAKTRSIPLRDDVVQHLKKYLALFHSEQNLFSEQYLFYVTRNQNRKRMTEDNVRKLIAKYGVQARKICKEVPENVHPHLFRHSWAMVLYQNGVDLTLISQWLGHSNLETTLIYAHADTELKRKALEKAVPVESPLKEHLNAERYKVSDEELLKRLCGLK